MIRCSGEFLVALGDLLTELGLCLGEDLETNVLGKVLVEGDLGALLLDLVI